MARKKNRAGDKAKELEIEIRRKNVAANLLGGLNYRQIAEALNVSLGTIADDVAAIIAQYKEATLKEAEDYVEVEIARIDTALNAIWKKIQDGNQGAIETMVLLQNQRAKYKPLHLATRLELSGPGGGPIPIEQVEEIRERRWNQVASKLIEVIDLPPDQVKDITPRRTKRKTEKSKALSG